nr:PTS glucose transporter subunit IIA [Catenibacillus scindens]
MVHIGIDTVSLEGKGFHVLKKQGDTVRAGEPVVRVDLDVVEKAGLSMQTMIIVTEPASDTPVAFINFGKVQRGQVINK